MTNPVDVEERKRPYEAVRAVCNAHGKEDPFGEGDFWVVDDCWGGVIQEIVVTNPTFITRKLVNELSACISQLGLLGAEVVVVLDEQTSGDSSGLIVYASGFEEYWNIDMLRSSYGSSFFT